LQEWPPCNAEKISKPWMMPMAGGIHSPSPANPIASMSAGTFPTLELASLSTEIILS